MLVEWYHRHYQRLFAIGVKSWKWTITLLIWCYDPFPAYNILLHLTSTQPWHHNAKLTVERFRFQYRISSKTLFSSVIHIKERFNILNVQCNWINFRRMLEMLTWPRGSLSAASFTIGSKWPYSSSSLVRPIGMKTPPLSRFFLFIA